MAIGLALTKENINNSISGYATNLHILNTKLAGMVQDIASLTDPDLLALGFTIEDVAEIRAYFGALGNLLLNAGGAGVIAGQGNSVATLINENAKYVTFGA